jgi:hypothetical protein
VRSVRDAREVKLSETSRRQSRTYLKPFSGTSGDADGSDRPTLRSYDAEND